MCSISLSYVWHDIFIRVTTTHPYISPAFQIMCPVYVRFLNHMCGMTYEFVWHDSSIYITRLSIMCPVYVRFLIHICGVSHSYVWHDVCICVTWLIHMYQLPFFCAPVSPLPYIIEWKIILATLEAEFLIFLLFCTKRKSFARPWQQPQSDAKNQKLPL